MNHKVTMSEVDELLSRCNSCKLQSDTITEHVKVCNIYKCNNLLCEFQVLIDANIKSAMDKHYLKCN